jgi:hypothetical protein
MARRFQYKALSFVPLVNTETFIPVFSQQTAIITIPVRFQYQSHFRDLTFGSTPETITVDKWFLQTSQPVRKSNLTYRYPSYFSDPNTITPETITVDKWFRPIVQPTLRKKDTYRYPSYFSDNSGLAAVPETITVDKWFRPTQEPTRVSTRRPHLRGGLFYTDRQIITETITLDKWFNANTQPYFRKKNLGYLYQPWSFDKYTITIVDPAIGVMLGRNNDTNIGIGKRGKADLGLNKDTNTGIGTRRIS